MRPREKTSLASVAVASMIDVASIACSSDEEEEEEMDEWTESRIAIPTSGAA